MRYPPQWKRDIIGALHKADYYSLTVDESSTDVVQVCVYVRYFDGKSFKEEVLSLIPLEEHTTISRGAVYAAFIIT